MSDIKTNKAQPNIVPYKCPKCKKGTMEEKCNGRVYVCSNPECRATSWLYFEDNRISVNK